VASQSSIRAAEAHVELTLRDNQFTRGLAAAEKKMAAFGRGLAKLGGGALGAGLGAGAPFGFAANSFAKAGASISAMSASSGMGVEQIQALTYAAEQLSIPVEQVIEGFSDWNKVMERAAGGDKAAQALINQRKEIESLVDEAGRLGIVLSKEDVAAAKAFDQALKSLSATATTIWKVVGAAVADVLMPWAKSAKDAAKGALDWVRSNRELIGTIAIVAGGVAAGGAALLGLSALAYGGSVAMAGLSAAIGVAATAFGVLTSPLTIAGVGLGVIVSQTIPVRSAFEEMGEGAEAFGDIATTAWDGIKAAFSSGDLEGALKVATEAATATWTSFTAGLEGVWNDFYLFIRDTLSMIGQAVQSAFTTMFKLMNDLERWIGDLGELEIFGSIETAMKRKSNPEQFASEQAARVGKRKSDTDAANAAMDAALAQAQAERDANMMRRREARDAANAALKAEAEAARGQLKKVANEAEIDAMTKAVTDAFFGDLFKSGGPSFGELSGGNRAQGTFSGELATRGGFGAGPLEKIAANTNEANKKAERVIDAINSLGVEWL